MATDFAMYTDAGNRAVERCVIQPTIAAIDAPPTSALDLNIRKRAEQALRDGMDHVARLGFPEVIDTEVRECIYHAVGKALLERGVLRDGDDLYNWEA